MAINFKVLAICLLAFSPCLTSAVTVIDATKYGVKGNDLTQSLSAAWKEVCASENPTRLVIPPGTFMLGEINLFGPCKSKIELKVDGTLKAPENYKIFRAKGAWITFKNLNGISVLGSGTLDGQGAQAWAACIRSSCALLPVIMRFSLVTNGSVEGITLTNSKHFHMCLNDCKNVAINNIRIQSPADSPNTDGIHIGHSSYISVTNTVIRTGDDCISMIHGNKHLTISGVHCGPGHGISLGSLGKFQHEGPVDTISVTDCTLEDTTNGVRIKTLPNNRVGTAKNIRFENLVMKNVSNPVIIDQSYCGFDNCPKGIPSNIQISNVNFKNIKGTSATPLAVKMVCSETHPCQNVAIGDIDLTYNGPKGKTRSLCQNIKPQLFGYQNPALCVDAELDH